MVPFVLKVTGRLGIKPVPYLLALATASNIGSTATITGNPQNILIGSVSNISYLDFLAHLGPVALIGLFLDWAVLHWVYFRRKGPQPVAQPQWLEPLAVKKSRLIFPVTITLLVLLGFLLGAP